MERPEVCPECGSDELSSSLRSSSTRGTLRVFVCGACHWISDPTLGRPPADRSKNVTLRRLLAGTPDRRRRARVGS